MKRELENILNEFLNFKNYLENLDESVFEDCSRAELNTFLKVLNESEEYNIKDYKLQNNIRKIIKRKKTEEYPELLGVHSFPKLKKIDFLSEKDKIKLDTFLANLNTNITLRADSVMWMDFMDELETKNISKKILEFLYDNKMVEKRIRACKCCFSHTYLEDILKKIKEYITTTNYDIKNDLQEELGDYLYCYECEEEISFSEKEIETLLNTPIEHCVFKFIATRDTSLDNV